MSQIKVLALDCDGVMFNSEKANTAYYDRILQHVGLSPMTREQFGYVHMHTVSEALAYLFPNEELLREAYTFARDTGYFDFIKLMEIEPYLKTLLTNIRPPLKTAVATNRTNTMGLVLKEHGLASYFDLIVCALDVAQPKPYPDMLFKALAHFGVRSDEMLFVGDSQLDAQAAQAANVPFVAYGNPSLEASYHITSFESLENVIGLH